ncbi:hypothetical protein P9847_27490 [Paenibacillus chibensis]|uniref:Uncharacterized protein n=1 Tax=Paenibacillus chibensis TaxID=59846 RepID=A0ABU6Q319_9BACL|nr:hypothetical protein [Paenibacillus chibensis]
MANPSDETRHSKAKPWTALTRICRIAGLMLLCWCAFFACSEAALLAYDAIVRSVIR